MQSLDDSLACLAKKEGTGYYEKHLITTVKFGVGSLMLWGCFVTGGSRALMKMNDIMNSAIQDISVQKPLAKALPIDRAFNKKMSKTYIQINTGTVKDLLHVVFFLYINCCCFS